MALSIFINKEHVPDENDLQAALGATYPLWNDIKNFVHGNYNGALEQWNHSGKNYGWGFRLKDKKRVIIYLTPCEGFFKASLVFGEKATNMALSKNISDETRAIIENAPVYAEGRGIRLDVLNDFHLDDIKILILVKLEN